MSRQKMDGFEFYQKIAPFLGLGNRLIKRMAILIEEGRDVELFIEEVAEVDVSGATGVLAEVSFVVTAAKEGEIDTTTFLNKVWRTKKPRSG